MALPIGYKPCDSLRQALEQLTEVVSKEVASDQAMLRQLRKEHFDQAMLGQLDDTYVHGPQDT